MKCSACGRDNAAGRRFCGGCGVALFKACQGCAFVNESFDRFCGGCGESLGAAIAAPRAEAAPSVTLSSTAPLPLPGAEETPAPLRVVSGLESDADVEGIRPEPGVPSLSQDELSELLSNRSSPRRAQPALPAKVTQEDLDKLFGTGA